MKSWVNIGGHFYLFFCRFTFRNWESRYGNNEESKAENDKCLELLVKWKINEMDILLTKFNATFLVFLLEKTLLKNAVLKQLTMLTSHFLKRKSAWWSLLCCLRVKPDEKVSQLFHSECEFWWTSSSFIYHALDVQSFLVTFVSAVLRKSCWN